MDDSNRKMLLLQEAEIDHILDNNHKFFQMEEVTHSNGDSYKLIFSNENDEYFETYFSEDAQRGIYYTQSYANQVFQKTRKATVIVYE